MGRTIIRTISTALIIGILAAGTTSTLAPISAGAEEQQQLEDGEVRFDNSYYTVASDKDLVKQPATITNGTYYTKDLGQYKSGKSFKNNLNITYHFVDRDTDSKVYPDVTVKNAWINGERWHNSATVNAWSIVSPIASFGNYQCIALPVQDKTLQAKDYVGMTGNVEIKVRCGVYTKPAGSWYWTEDRTASVGNWYKQSDGWHFCYVTGYRVSDTRFVVDKDQTYYFINGVMQTGWQKIYHEMDKKYYWHYYDQYGHNIPSKTIEA